VALRALGTPVRRHSKGHGVVRLVVQFHEVIVVGVAFRVKGRFTVAVNAPAHRESRVLVHNFHVLDGTVASLALDATNLRVLRVVEVSEVG